MPDNEKMVHLFIEDTAGNRFECKISSDTKLSTVATDFFENLDWRNSSRSQRAVVELVDPENPDRTKRLNGDASVDQAGLWDGAILRIFPESIAGIPHMGHRSATLTQDHNSMIKLSEWNKRITFEAKPEQTPTYYRIYLNYPGFKELSPDRKMPVIINDHQVEIRLISGYPQTAPLVEWKTPIFHPNIDPASGAVCLGVLMDRFLPGLGLSRIVTLLAEMVQWRNFDITNALNKEASQWGADPNNWEYIRQIGGSPFQGPIEDILKKLKKSWHGKGVRPRIKFESITKERNEQ